MAPTGRLAADQAGTIQQEVPAETAPDSTMQMVQEADSVQQDYSVWQMPPQLDENGRQTAAIFGPAPSPAETPAASHAITEDIAADPVHFGMRTSYMEGDAGPDHESHLAQCMDHLRTHWPAIIPFLENHE